VDGDSFETSGPRGDGSAGLLPEWFHQLDADGDGQIGLYEWRAAGRPLDEFQRMDRNQDGFITPNELRYSLAQSDQRRDGNSVSSGAAIGRASPGLKTDTARPRPQSTPSAATATRSDSPSTNRASPQPTAPKSQSRAPASAAAPPTVAPASTDLLATTPLPLNDGSVPYWLARELQNEARIRLGHANVLFLGDSITDALQSGSGRPIWKTFFAPLGAADFAIGGITTSQVLWQVQTGQAAALTPNVVVLLIGSNNLGLGQSPAATTAGIEAVVDQINHQLPDTRILLLGLLPRSASAADPIRAAIAQVNRSIAKLADGRRVRYLDFGAAFLLPDGTLTQAVMPDLLHPNLLGYQIYTAAIWQPLLAALGEP